MKEGAIDDLVNGRTEGREHIGPLPPSMTSLMDERGRHRRPHQWTHRGRGRTKTQAGSCHCCGASLSPIARHSHVAHVASVPSDISLFHFRSLRNHAVSIPTFALPVTKNVSGTYHHKSDSEPNSHVGFGFFPIAWLVNLYRNAKDKECKRQSATLFFSQSTFLKKPIDRYS